MRARKSESAVSKPSKTKGETSRAYQANDRLRHEVELKAYFNFLDRQQFNKPGNELSDWLEAEKAVSKNMTHGS